PGLFVLRPEPRISPAYLQAVLQTWEVNAQLQLRAPAATMFPRVRLADFADVLVPRPESQFGQALLRQKGSAAAARDLGLRPPIQDSDRELHRAAVSASPRTVRAADVRLVAPLTPADVASNAVAIASAAAPPQLFTIQ